MAVKMNILIMTFLDIENYNEVNSNLTTDILWLIHKNSQTPVGVIEITHTKMARFIFFHIHIKIWKR